MKKLFMAAALCLALCFAPLAAACSGGDSGEDKEDGEGYYLAFLGDSITYGQGCSSQSARFTNLIAKQDFVSYAQNVGFSGATVGTSGGVMDSYAFVNRYSQISENADLIFVLGGTNDYGATTGEVPLGKAGDEGTDTFYGAYTTLLERLSAKYPQAVIVTATPFQRDNSITGYPEGELNDSGNTLKEYCDAVKELSAQYNLTCVDFYNLEGMRLSDETFSTYFEDGLHPNDAGNKVIADYLIPVLRQILTEN